MIDIVAKVALAWLALTGIEQYNLIEKWVKKLSKTTYANYTEIIKEFELDGIISQIYIDISALMENNYSGLYEYDKKLMKDGYRGIICVERLVYLVVNKFFAFHAAKKKKHDKLFPVSLEENIGSSDDSDFTLLDLVAVDENSVEDMVIFSIMTENILASFDDKDRKIFEMFYFGKFKQKEIAAEMNISIPAVCKRIKKASKAFSEAFAA